MKHTIKQLLNLKETNGDIGLEIEMETNKSLHHEFDGGSKIPAGPCWKLETDNSLKGYAGEWVFKKPLPLDKVGGAIASLEAGLKMEGITINDSVRAGVHIHLNMQTLTEAELVRFLLVYYSLETFLVNACGDGRQGNLFCLRVQDADGHIQMLNNYIHSGLLNHIKHSEMRYCSLNIQSLFTYGSVEFRAIRTPQDLSSLIFWCELFVRMRTFAKNLDGCWDIVAKISGDGPSEWARTVLGDEAYQKLRYQGDESDILNDIRRIQFTCFTATEKGM